MGSHIIDGEFQSDKYPTCPRGKVPLSVKDESAQDLLWEYAKRRREVDAEFSADLEAALRAAGYVPSGEALLGCDKDIELIELDARQEDPVPDEISRVVDMPGSPWFVVGTPFGDLTIGWRKRVLSIEWPKEVAIDWGTDGKETTNGEGYIHAWGYPKAREYLQKIRVAMRAAGR